MNAVSPAHVSDLWFVAGWTMLHFLWIGAIVAAIALGCRALLRRATSNARYSVALASLCLLAALPVVTAAWLLEHSPPLKGGAGGGIDRPIAQSPAAPVPAPTVSTFPENSLAAPPNGKSSNGAINTSQAAPGHGSAVADSAGGLLAPLPQSNVATLAPAPSTDDPRQSRGLPETTAPPAKFSDTLSTFIPYLPWLWLIGSPITFAMLVSGVVGTRRLSRASRLIENDPITDLLAHLSASLRITRRVTVAVCDRIASPVLIGIVRPMILLPPAAITGWSPDEIEMVLLHELAHVRRWDNLINLLQRCLESLLFFHPAVWLISSWVRQEREACCDATVVSRTNRPHAYAELLVALAAQLPRSVLFHPAASSAMASGPLRSRIRHILKLEEDPMLISGKSLAIVLATISAATLALVLYTPIAGRAEQSAKNEIADTNSEKEIAEVDAILKPEPGDEFKPLKFNLKSNGAGKMEVSLNGKAIRESLMREVIQRAENHPNDFVISVKAEKGVNFGEVIKFVDKLEAAGIKKLSLDTREASGSKEEYPYVVQFEKGAGKFLDGDEITITEIRGTAKEIKPGNKYRIIGKYKLHSNATARISAYTTVKDAKDDHGPTQSAQSQEITQGDGDFTLVLPMSVPGWPHVSFYANGDDLGGVYFGTGDSVLKKWWGSEKPGDSAQSDLASGTQQKDDAGIVIAADKIEFNNGQLRASGLIALDQSGVSPGARSQNKASKFPTLEEQKLADLAYKRLGIELEPIGEADLKRVKALGYDGGVKVTLGHSGINGEMIQYGDILVGLHAWPTTNLQDIAQVLNRPDIEDLNPLKFYVVRASSLPAPPGAAPQVKDEVETGRISVSAAPASKDRPGANPAFITAENTPVTNNAPVASASPIPALSQPLQTAQQPQLNASSRPYAAPNPYGSPVTALAPLPAMAPSPIALQVAEAEKRVDDAMRRKNDALATRTAAKGDDVEKAKRDLDAANKQLDDAKRQREELKQQQSQYSSQPFADSQAPYEQRSRTLPDGKTVIETYPVGQPTANFSPYVPTPAASSPTSAVPVIADASPKLVAGPGATRTLGPPIATVPRTPFGNERDITQPVRNAFTYAAEQLEAAMKRKSEAMDKRLQAKEPEAIEKAKKDLEAANRQLEEAKRQFEKAKVQQEQLDTEKYNKNSGQPNAQPVTSWQQTSSTWSPVAQPPSNTAWFYTWPPQPPSPEEIEILRDRVRTIEEQLAYTNERLKAGRGATELDVKQVACELAVAQGEQALAEGNRKAAIEKLQEARKQAEDALQIQSQSARAGIGSPDLDGIMKAKRSLSDIKLKLIRLQHEAPQPNSSNDDWGHPPAQPPKESQPKIDGKSSSDSPPADDPSNTPEQVLRAPEVAPASASPTAKPDSSRLVAPQPHPYDVAAPNPPLAPIWGDPNVVQGSGDQPTTLSSANVKWTSDPQQPGVLVQTNGQPSTTRPDVRYDGKTFIQWRNALQTELSTEKRTDAIKALAAFGRAGYRQEVAETILDIAGEYDFTILEGDASPEGKLKETILDQLAPPYRNQPLVQYWLSSLADRLRQDPEKWFALYAALLERTRPSDAATIKTLKTLAASEKKNIANVALGTLIICDGNNEETRALADKALHSDDATTVRDILRWLVCPRNFPAGYATQVIKVSDIVPLVLHSNDEVRNAALAVIADSQLVDTKNAVAELTAIVQDDSRPADRLAAIRALGAVGAPAESAVAILEKIMSDDKDRQQEVAAAFAIDRIEGSTRGRNVITVGASGVRGKEQDRMLRLINEEGQLQPAK